MRRAQLILVLCLIMLTPMACARRSGRAARTPAAPAASTAQKAARGDAASQVREAIRSLKERLGAESGKADEAPAGTSLTVVPHGTAAADPKADPKHVGTGGAWSVETRYPIAQAEPPSRRIGSPPGEDLLRRAGEAVGHVPGGRWMGVLALCLAAVALVALAMRRARTST